MYRVNKYLLSPSLYLVFSSSEQGLSQSKVFMRDYEAGIVVQQVPLARPTSHTREPVPAPASRILIWLPADVPKKQQMRVTPWWLR